VIGGTDILKSMTYKRQPGRWFLPSKDMAGGAVGGGCGLCLNRTDFDEYNSGSGPENLEVIP
jgi:hypothetical protein